MDKNLWTQIMDNVTFVAVCIVVAVILVLLAYTLEKINRKINGVKEGTLSTRRITMIGLFSAVSAILMMVEFPVPFAPPFYKLDISEVPILIGAFAFGPVPGVLMEFIKVILHIVFIGGSSTAFVGDFANFAVGCSFILPASAIYMFKKTRISAIVSCVIGTIIITIFGTLFNAVYLLPAFAKLYGMPLDVIIGMGTEINAAIKDVYTFVFFAVAPLNVLKGTCVSLITMLVYKRLSPILKK